MEGTVLDSYGKSLRLGAAVIAWALILRLYSAGFFDTAVQWLAKPEVTAAIVYLQTGRQLSPAPAQVIDYPVESPELPPAETQTLPVFFREDGDLVKLSYACSLRPDVDALLEAPLALDLLGDGPKVLILHTHSTESYMKSGEDYRETSAYRTLDERYNMLSIGAEVKRVLEQAGVEVIQDRELHDYPSYNGSYSDARKSIRSYLEEYPSIALVLDIHRDAADTPSGQLRTVAQVDGASSAQLMLVMGTNASGQKHPCWQDNLSLGLKLQTVLEREYPGITRPTVLRKQRFNQDLSTGALLVEVGAAGNTHEEAMLAARTLARGILLLAGID